MSTELDRRNHQAATHNLLFNLLLTVVKLVAGVMGRSEALIADGVHSGADVLSSIAVVIGLAGAGRPPDAGHHYGHAKAEAISQNVVAVLLLLAGMEVANTAISGIARASSKPSWLALAVALAAMLPKAFMAISQRRLARRTGSHAVLAASVDNRVDAASSLIAASGILASRMGFVSGDSIAALVVALLVMWGGVEVFRTAANDLMDPAADNATEASIHSVAAAVQGVRSVSSLRTRVNGAGVLVDLEVEVDRDLSLVAAHDIAHAVEDAVTQLERVRGATVHVNPAREDEKL
ncbi:MAG: cation transporter [Sulfobacillus acidophilus]|uniref:Cation transporter n=1 Tax=Sulfobacillus acidophilus TaxID=53633 RepID=A0A2T2WPN0_9FIRM|nr:MAG: cation transporter [Sulfobacillus acidophilus]